MRSRKRGSAVLVILLIAAVLIIISQYKNIIRNFYPMEYKDQVIKYSKIYDIDPCMVFALINVESHYDANALSNKDARGLMQITSSTGKWAAVKMGIKNFKESMLYNPEINIRIGCWYLNNLKSEFRLDNDEESSILVLAAYNGGSGNVEKWLTDKEYSQSGTTLDQIPFPETKQYIEKVFRDQKMYEWLYPDI